MKMLRIRRTALSFAAAIKLPCRPASATPSAPATATAAAVCMYVYYANFKFSFGFIVVKLLRRPHKFRPSPFFWFVGQCGIWNSVSMH